METPIYDWGLALWQVEIEFSQTYFAVCEFLFCLFDLYSPDSRVIRLIKCMGEEENPKQKRILCMNKVDLVEKKKDLLKVAEEFQNLPAYERWYDCT